MPRTCRTDVCRRVCVLPIALLALTLPAGVATAQGEPIEWRHDLPSLSDASVFHWQQADIEADRRQAEAAVAYAEAAERIAAATERQAEAIERLAVASQAQADAAKATRATLARIAEAVDDINVTAQLELPEDVRQSVLAATRAVAAWLAPPNANGR